MALNIFRNYGNSTYTSGLENAEYFTYITIILTAFLHLVSTCKHSGLKPEKKETDRLIAHSEYMNEIISINIFVYSRYVVNCLHV